MITFLTIFAGIILGYLLLGVIITLWLNTKSMADYKDQLFDEDTGTENAFAIITWPLVLVSIFLIYSIETFIRRSKNHYKKEK